MPDPKHLLTGDPSRDELLDPATLPCGLRLDTEERNQYMMLRATAGQNQHAARLRAQTPPKPEKVTILYPFLFAAFPKWTYGLQGRGDCMAWSACFNLDVLAAVDAVLHKPITKWPGLTVIEAEYALMRVEVYGGKPDLGGDGASPTAAAKAVQHYGHLHRTETPLEGYDLSNYDASGGRSGRWGRYGLPDKLEPYAKAHLCVDTTPVNDFDQAVALLSNGYPISVASGQNPIYRRRDATGYGMDPWNASHAMNYVGFRTDPEPALLKVNWGHGHHVTGPHWPDDMPTTLKACTAWEKKPTVNHILRQEWSWAYALDHNFPARNLGPLATLD